MTILSLGIYLYFLILVISSFFQVNKDNESIYKEDSAKITGIVGYVYLLIK